MPTDITKLQDLAISDTGFVFDPLTGHTFTVNTTGLSLLRALKDGASEEDMVTRLRDQFDSDGGEDPARDLAEFLSSLRTLGLVR